MLPIAFNLQGRTITPSPCVKFLGVWLDTKLIFPVQVRQVSVKAEKTVSALAKLKPNIGGTRPSKQKVLSSVAYYQFLYRAPAWHAATQNKKLVQNLTETERKITIRICRAHITVSGLQRLHVFSRELSPFNYRSLSEENDILG